MVTCRGRPPEDSNSVFSRVEGCLLANSKGREGITLVSIRVALAMPLVAVDRLASEVELSGHSSEITDIVVVCGTVVMACGLLVEMVTAFEGFWDDRISV